MEHTQEDIYDEKANINDFFNSNSEIVLLLTKPSSNTVKFKIQVGLSDGRVLENDTEDAIIE